MFFRTDLALELKEGGQSELLDVPCKIKEKDRCKISHITVPCHIKDTGMAPGEYITIEMPPLSDALDENNRFLQVVSDEIKPFLPENGEVLVAGLGNAAITPDALGEKVIAQILATRHVKKELERITGISELRSVAAVSTDVLGNTGMETAEILKGLTQQLRPKAVIVIDAMAARSLERLGKTVQISTAGIAPGSCDSREEVSQEKGGKIFSKASEKRHRIVCRRRKGLTVAGGSVCRQRRKPVYGRLYIGRTGQNQPGPAG